MLTYINCQLFISTYKNEHPSHSVIFATMNPFNKFRNWLIGNALARTNDLFEKGKVELLFNYSFLFLLLSVMFLLTSINAPLPFFILSIVGIVALISVLITLKVAKNVVWAFYVYIFNHTVQNFSYMLLENGKPSLEAIPFLILYVSFGFLLLGRKWGFGLTLLSVICMIVAIYNYESGASLYHFDAGDHMKDAPPYIALIPFLLNIYLVSEFLKARQKAEEEIAKQRVLLEESHAELAVKNQDIISSINYASRIQQALLPSEETIYRSIPLSFILYKPRDIVCGDFFWFHEIDHDNYIIVCADCTGHGVPGALMTIIGTSLLNQVVVDGNITTPTAVLTELDNLITSRLKQEKQRLGLVQDSMDLALLKVNKKNKEFVFCSAKRPAIFIHSGVSTELKGNKSTLGGLKEGEKKFEETRINYKEDDVIYLFTDGYTDQFGGESDKKFMIKQFREVLIKIHKLSMNEQKVKLDTTIEAWKKNDSQTDDILVIGIRF
jgi:serine phosphatase RsbU (regulator of sigma subunit)